MKIQNVQIFKVYITAIYSTYHENITTSVVMIRMSLNRQFHHIISCVLRQKKVCKNTEISLDEAERGVV